MCKCSCALDPLLLCATVQHPIDKEAGLSVNVKPVQDLDTVAKYMFVGHSLEMNCEGVENEL